MLRWTLMEVVMMMVVVWGVMVGAATVKSNGGSSEGSTFNMDVLMKGAKPEIKDSYICSGYDVQEDEAYIVKFEALAFANTAHHILLYGCDDGGYSSEDFWDCPPICRGNQQIIFAWAKNAPPTQLPDGVGFRIGRNTSIKTIILQIHYARSFDADEKGDTSGIRLHISKEKQRYVAGVFLMAGGDFDIPPNQTSYSVDVSCRFPLDYNIYPFAYRTHAHQLGSVIVGYQYNSTGYHTIGKGNPQWPQAFYPSNTSIEVKPGDSLVARCTYNSVGLDHTVSVGSTGDDEMCNFYFMFYTDSSVEEPTGVCGGVELPSLVEDMPADASVTMAPRPLLEAAAHAHHHHQQMAAASSSSSHGSSGTVGSPVDTGERLDGPLVFQSEWPQDKVEMGQVGGVATDAHGNVYIFHRGERTWEPSSFDSNNTFQLRDQPIKQDTVLVLSPDGRLIRKFGKNRHFMPHGLAVDHDGNIWLTDVALHQVFRVPANGTVANLILGERFVNGKDRDHFCKPSDVAVLKSGEFFVSDGYCNARIIKFSKDGRFLKEWGHSNTGGEPGPGEFFLPHSVSVVHDLQLVCVADRENGRIQCFDLEGNFKFLIKDPQFGPTVYAVEYCPDHGGLLFAVNGMESRHVSGFTFSLASQSHPLLESWNLPSPQSLSKPHDVAVDTGNHAVYVGELDPPVVRKFARRPVDTNSVIPVRSGQVTIPPKPASHDSAGSGQKLDNQSTAHKTEGQTTHSAEGEGRKDWAGPKGGAEEEGVSGLSPVMLVGPLVAIPLMLVMVFIIFKHRQGWNGCCPQSKTANGVKLSHSRHGFDPLLQNISDDSDDDENEMFIKPRARKVQTD